MSKTETERALAMFDAAARSRNPDWRAVALALVSVVPPPKKPPAGSRKTRLRDDGFADIVSYEPKGKATRVGPTIVVEFADGTKVRGTFASQDDKPINGGLGLRIACAFYRTLISAPYHPMLPRDEPRSDLDEINRIGVPAIVAAHVERDRKRLAKFEPGEATKYIAPYAGGTPFAKWKVKIETAARARKRVAV